MNIHTWCRVIDLLRQPYIMLEPIVKWIGKLLRHENLFCLLANADLNLTVCDRSYSDELDN